MSPTPEREPPPDLEEPDPRLAAAAGGCFYSMLLVASIVWLALRDRLDALPVAAAGRHGALAAIGAGLAVGLCGYAVFAVGILRWRAFATTRDQVRQMFGGLEEHPLLALVLVGAVSEEMFFRLAVQDQFGLTGSVAAYSLLATGAMGPLWLPVAALHAFVLGSLMTTGFGLLSTTIANAVMNYLALRRMLN